MALTGCLGDSSAPSPLIELILEIDARIRSLELDQVQAHIVGSSPETTDHLLQLNLSDGEWTGEIDALAVGTYTVTVEGWSGDRIAVVGEQAGVSVKANTIAEITVTLESFQPQLRTGPSPTSSFAIPILITGLPLATGYMAEWDDNPDFMNPTRITLEGTTSHISVIALGAYYFRATAILNGDSGMASETNLVEVVADETPSGANQGEAPLLGFGTAADGRLRGLNIDTSNDQDWFSLEGCKFDEVSVSVETTTLDPPSLLEPRLQLYSESGPLGSTEVGSGATVTSTLDRDGRISALVESSNQSVGHYELAIATDEGEGNLGTHCVRIAFERHRDGSSEIYVMHVDGSDTTNLTNHPNEDHGPDWSRGGDAIAFESRRPGNWDVFVMNSDGTNLQNLTGSDGFDGEASWDPTGTRLVFARIRDGARDLYTFDMPTATVMRLTDDGASELNPSWSPDGRYIAFSSDKWGSRKISLFDVETSETSQITNTAANDFDPSWSPDGTRIIFERVDASASDIWVMNADGSNQVRITDHPSDDIDPDWSPDGESIAFASLRDGNFEIYVVTTTGDELIRLTHDPAQDIRPKWRR